MWRFTGQLTVKLRRIILRALMLGAISISFLSSLFSYTFAQQVFLGICDASAAISIDVDYFLVAHDEAFSEDGGDTLYLYKNDISAEEGVQPVKKINIRSDLELPNPELDEESDIEGAARFGNRIFWITSHGRNSKGKIKPNRYRLFATDLTGSLPEMDLSFVGFYPSLIQDIQKRANWKNPKDTLGAVARSALAASLQLGDDLTDEASSMTEEELTKKQRKAIRRKLAPKRDGINIEGLAVGSDGTTLLIGFRNPKIHEDALVIPLLNANALIEGQAEAALFGDPITLFLKGRGIRSMDYVPELEAFLIVAGSRDDNKYPMQSLLFKWSGGVDDDPVEIRRLYQSKGVNPEALVFREDPPRVQVLHDEGSRQVNGVECKKVQRDLRSFTDRIYIME